MFLGKAIGRHILSFLLFAIIFSFGVKSAEAITLVFVHGKGSGKDTVTNVTNNYWTTDMISAATRNYAAKSLVVSYDGSQYYWDTSSDISAQINNYLNLYPTEKLVFICHSYGGIQMRFILCNSTPSSPYYNYRGANFARIAAATSHVITLATPHGGSEVADLGSTLSNSAFTSWIVSLVDNNSNASKVLTSSHLQYASQNWLRDSLRTKAFYTVAGTNTLNHIYHLNDIGLSTLSLLAPFNGANDGLVATWSAHYPGAPGGDWFNTSANHDHNRHNDDPGYIGNTIGQYGW
jgi:triacylglycerol esterase/lipase EstA (alpha/beta hydrolase family)